MTGSRSPWLLGGLFIGVLSSLPIVSMGNLCCCLWVVLGGVLTVYLQHQDEHRVIESGDAALAGLLAGLVGSAIFLLVTAFFFSISGGLMEAEIQSRIAQVELPPETRDNLTRFFTGPRLFVALGVVTVPVYAMASALGALLGFAWFRRRRTPPVVQA